MQDATRPPGWNRVYDFFSGDMSALSDVVQQITTNGDSAWQLASQGSPLPYDFLDPDAPVHYVQSGKGTLLVQVLVDPNVLGRRRRVQTGRYRNDLSGDKSGANQYYRQ